MVKRPNFTCGWCVCTFCPNLLHSRSADRDSVSLSLQPQRSHLHLCLASSGRTWRQILNSYTDIVRTYIEQLAFEKATNAKSLYLSHTPIPEVVLDIQFWRKRPMHTLCHLLLHNHSNDIRIRKRSRLKGGWEESPVDSAGAGHWIREVC